MLEYRLGFSAGACEYCGACPSAPVVIRADRGDKGHGADVCVITTSGTVAGKGTVALLGVQVEGSARRAAACDRQNYRGADERSSTARGLPKSAAPSRIRASYSAKGSRPTAARRSSRPPGSSTGNSTSPPSPGKYWVP